MQKKAIVIGAGFSGLSVATFLAQAGFNVTILEKHTSPGGRARKFSESGFTFDMGPSWYWMPDVFESYFGKFGKKVSDYYQLNRLSPSYRVYYPNNEFIDVPSDLNEIYSMFEEIEKGSADKLKHFLKGAEYKYRVGIQDLVYKPGRKLSEYLEFKLLVGLFKMDVFKPISKEIRTLFKNKKLIDLLEFPVLFLGAKPCKTPALYSLMNYADLVLGTWYPEGGMHKIVEGMYKLARENGVQFEFEQDVQQCEIESQKVKAVKTNKGIFPSDVFISSADYHFTESKLLPNEFRNYSEAYWQSRTLAPSSLIFYLGLNRKVPNLLHHNLFFDKDFEKHSSEIYDSPIWPSEPQFYVSCTSVSDNTVAPKGMENLFILIPVAPDLIDTKETREKYFKIVIKRIEERVGIQLMDHIIYRRDYAHKDFIKDYNSFKGNAYGLANTLKQTAIFKPGIKNKKLKNLYYTGQLTVPGPGVPPSLISGEVVAKEVIKDLRK